MKRKVLKMGLLLLGALMVGGVLAGVFLFKLEEGEPVNVPQRERILSSSVKDCILRVETSVRERRIETNIGDLYPRIDCFAPFVRALSLSGRYLAYRDISGGVDSTVEVYSADNSDTVRLDVLGTSGIFDMAFAPGERLLVLNGYEGIYDEQYLRIYQVGALFSKYPDNVKIDGRYFTDIKAHSETRSLPDKGEDYEEIKVTGKTVKLYGESGDLLKELEI